MTQPPVVDAEPVVTPSPKTSERAEPKASVERAPERIAVRPAASDLETSPARVTEPLPEGRELVRTELGNAPVARGPDALDGLFVPMPQPIPTTEASQASLPDQAMAEPGLDFDTWPAPIPPLPSDWIEPLPQPDITEQQEWMSTPEPFTESARVLNDWGNQYPPGAASETIPTTTEDVPDDALIAYAETLATYGIQTPTQRQLIGQAVDFETLDQSEKADQLAERAQRLEALNLPLAALRVSAERLDHLSSFALDQEIDRLIARIEALPAATQAELASGTDHLAGLVAASLLTPASEASTQARWVRKFSWHPILKSTRSTFDFLKAIEPPSVFAVTLLLPLSGELEMVGRAIRDGVLYQFNQRSGAASIEVIIKDSETMSPADWAALAQDGRVDFIIGPLQKQQIGRLMAMNPAAPVLLLNRPDSVGATLTTADGMDYALSLAIEDDAASAVDYVATNTVRPRVLTLYSDSVLGQRVATAVAARLDVLSGSHAASFGLEPATYESTISQALGVTDSRNRKQALGQLLNLPLEYTPRSRQDIDAVVVQTDPEQARQIRPLLDFYYLGDTPVYLIGAYRRDLARMTEDFKRSHIVATPWELGSSAASALGTRSLSSGRLGPLTAMGIDALELAVRLGFGESVRFPGQTGFLQLGAQGLIERRVGLLSVNARESITEIRWETHLSPLGDTMDAE